LEIELGSLYLYGGKWNDPPPYTTLVEVFSFFQQNFQGLLFFESTSCK
jgi:hypothetical protein